MIVTSYHGNKNLEAEIKNIAERVVETNRIRKVKILTVLMHILHFYLKSFEKTTGKES